MYSSVSCHVFKTRKTMKNVIDRCGLLNERQRCRNPLKQSSDLRSDVASGCLHYNPPTGKYGKYLIISVYWFNVTTFQNKSCNKCCILNVGGEYIWLESCNFMIEGINNCFLGNPRFPFDFLVGMVLKVALQSSGADLPWPGHCSSQHGSPHCSSQTYQDELLIHLWVLVLTLEWPSR